MGGKAEGRSFLPGSCPLFCPGLGKKKKTQLQKAVLQA